MTCARGSRVFTLEVMMRKRKKAHRAATMMLRADIAPLLASDLEQEAKGALSTAFMVKAPDGAKIGMGAIVGVNKEQGTLCAVLELEPDNERAQQIWQMVQDHRTPALSCGYKVPQREGEGREVHVVPLVATRARS